jgi:hypothetical protein
MFMPIPVPRGTVSLSRKTGSQLKVVSVPHVHIELVGFTQPQGWVLIEAGWCLR